MLNLITGRSGSGKTHELYNRIQATLAENESARIYLLVPEQASFENEKQLLLRLGDTLSQRVHVLSFTRMAEIVFRDIGGIVGKRMDTTVSLLLMSRALSAVQDSLGLYGGKRADSQQYLQELLQLLSECKQCAVTPDDLAQTSRSLADGILKKKTQDLSLIFSAYDALVAQASLVDPQDDLSVLAKRLPESHLFDNAHCFIDGFKGFTGQEFAVLEALLPRVATMTVALCSDGLNTNNAVDRFFTADRTAARLREMAHAHNVPVAKRHHLSQNHRTADPALRHLESNFYAAHSEILDEPTEAVCITPCIDREAECRYAARAVRRLLRENGGFCRDFTVVVRNAELYNGLLETAFEREELPFYIDKRESILTQPLISLVESALAVVSERWDPADMLRLCKTGLLGFSPVSTAVLENYALLWNVCGNAWKTPFTKHPEGLGETFDKISQARLDRLNILRKRLAEPLIRFQTRLAGNRSGREFATAVFQLLQEWHVPRMVRFQAARMEAQGEHALSEQHARLWDCLMELLDKFALSLNATSLSVKQYADLFHLAVSNIDLGTLPQTLDSVHIGCADRIRYTAPKTVIILGANEGTFPAYPTGGNIFTDRERRRLIALGLPIADDADHQSAEERYYAYAAVSACSERLIVTYALRNGNEELFPSTLVETIKTCLPHHQKGTVGAEDALDIESAADAFERLTACFHDNSATAASLCEIFKNDSQYAPKLKAASRHASTLVFDDNQLSRRLFGEHLRLSPTQVDTFYGCRFAYFCKYGLRLKPRRSATLNAAQAGLLAHFVMQTVLPQYVRENWKNCTEERVRRDTAWAVAQYVRENLEGLEENPRFENQLSQLTELSFSLLWRVVQELRNSQFVPVDYELPVGRFDDDGNGISPWVLKTPDGATIQVRGVVDRVDIYKQENAAYVRVVDYKTGNKEFNLSEVLEGLNLQMLIYLFSIHEDRTRYGKTVPAGVLYLPAKLPVVQVARDLPDEEIEKARLATMRMNGLLLDDPAVLEGMEADLAGVFIPVSKTKRGALSATSSLASLEQFGRLQKRVAALLTEMVSTLHRGDIAAVPSVTATGSACRYCDFRDICAHEEDDPENTVAKRSLKDALRDLDTTEEGSSDV